MPRQNGMDLENRVPPDEQLPSFSAEPYPPEATITHHEAAGGAEKASAVPKLERRDAASLKRSSSGRVIGPRTSQSSAESPSLEEPPPPPPPPRDYTDNLIYPGLYAPSGFDMMSILVAVALRPNPRIDLGAIDAACALLLCDATKADMPIVYCSEPFERLTGYSRHEILGLNCRFLQSPDGNVQAGVRRTHVNDATVFHLKQQLLARQEAQTCLVNYKKGGRRFTNLLTTIPIRWQSAEVKYIVGFLADVGDQFWAQ